jgi:multiple sugar transport system substrate-binding protein
MKSKVWNVFAVLVVFTMLVAACAPAATPSAAPTTAPIEAPAASPTDPPVPTQASSTEKTQLTLWYHGAGNEVEKKIITQIIDDFNASQDKYEVVRQDFPQASYNDSVVAGALAGSLPDIIDMDGPNMPNWAWSGYIAPLNLPAGALDNFLPGAIGKWQGKVYSVGLWDAACGIYARKSVLDENGIRIPTFDEPWTKDEFDAALVTLQKTGKYEYPFNVGMAWTGEWYPYAFSPFLQSFGGDIIDRSTYLTAQDALNGPDAIAFGTWWQSLVTRKLMPGPTQSGADAETGFLDGKYAMQYAGNWSALAAIEKFGSDMIFLPPPDLGHGPKIGAASWQFGVSTKSKNQDGANAWIAFALQDKYLAEFSNGIGLIPATESAAALTKNYAPDGPLAVFYDLSSKYGTLRPPTPAYLTAAKIFGKAIADISNGADVTSTLDNAADEIDKDIQANNGYGFK